ncbi:hypothetical protein [Lysobacter sp. A286]
MSRRTFTRRFREATGTTVVKWLTSTKLQFRRLRVCRRRMRHLLYGCPLRAMNWHYALTRTTT